jgi:hypothetical protein
VIAAIQTTGLSFTFDRSIAPLIAALDAEGVPWRSIGFLPGTQSFTGMDDLNTDDPIFFYGSTMLTELAWERGWRTLVFYDPAWFDPQCWIGKRKDFLNETHRVISLDQLRRDWIAEPTFLKSVELKVLTGQVIEESDRNEWIADRDHLDGEILVLLSPFHEIDKEWRFFVVDGAVVTGSLYRSNGQVSILDPISDDMWARAQTLTLDWMPTDTVVMDVAMLRTGECKIVEFNCLNSSGVYNSNMNDLVAALRNKLIGQKT